MTCLHRSGAAHNFYPRPPRGGRRPCAHCSPLGGRISIHALREEGDEGRGGQFCSLDIFLSTPSARRATWHHRHVYGPQRISIHALREEGDNTSNTTTAPARKISIHALREEGDGSSSKGNGKACKFLSTPSARRATSPIPTWRICDHISIHALREEGDPGHGDKSGAVRNFYPRPPRGGRLLIAHPPCTYLTFLSTPSARRATRGTSMKAATKTLFLSTPSARRATGAARAAERSRQYFYPRPPRGGRLRFGLCAALPVHISIHALREEGDPQLERGKLPVTNYFYPRPPRGGRRSACRRKLRCCPISIHALREEGDCRHARDHAVQLNFYPRPPRGGRQYLYRSYHTLGGFLSTPSARRATPTATTSLNSRKNFYPRPPRGGRPVVVLQHVGFHQFLSTPSARRATLKTTITTNVGGISIHALREEGDRRAFLQGRLPVYFYPRPPRGGRLLILGELNEGLLISIHALREEGDP